MIKQFKLHITAWTTFPNLDKENRYRQPKQTWESSLNIVHCQAT